MVYNIGDKVLVTDVSPFKMGTVERVSEHKVGDQPASYLVRIDSKLPRWVNYNFVTTKENLVKDIVKILTWEG